MGDNPFHLQEKQKNERWQQFILCEGVLITKIKKDPNHSHLLLPFFFFIWKKISKLSNRQLLSSVDLQRCLVYTREEEEGENVPFLAIQTGNRSWVISFALDGVYSTNLLSLTFLYRYACTYTSWVNGRTPVESSMRLQSQAFRRFFSCCF